MTRITFFGVAAYEVVTSRGQHILLDPFLDENPRSPVKSHELERVDLIVVSHAAVDHLGDTETIARRTGAPVICGGEAKAYLTAKGIPASQIKMPDGAFASGVPMAFIVYADAGVRFYQYGDTAIFSDMKLQGELYQPTIFCAGIANPVEILH